MAVTTGLSPVGVGSSSRAVAITAGLSPIGIGSSSRSVAAASGWAAIHVGSSSRAVAITTGVSPIGVGSSSRAVVMAGGLSPIGIGSSSRAVALTRGLSPIGVGSSSRTVAMATGLSPVNIGSSGDSVMTSILVTTGLSPIALSTIGHITPEIITGLSPIDIGSSSDTITTLTTTTGLSPIQVGSVGHITPEITTGVAPVEVGTSSNVILWLPLSVTFTGTSDFSVLSSGTIPMAIDMDGESGFDLYFPYPVISDPVTGKTPYRIVLVTSAGTRLAELVNATLGTITTSLNELGVTDFTLPADSPEALLCIPTKREVQVWRGTALIWWGVILKARGDGNTITFQCSTLEWYFSRRVMGKVPTPNLLNNGSFDQGLKYWSFTYVKGSKPGATSIPAKPPTHSLTTNTLSGKYALSIAGSNGVKVSTSTLAGDANFATGSSTLSSAGIASINALCAGIAVTNPAITCRGHTDNVGSNASNYTLSVARGNSVKARILTQIPSAVVTVIGYGETQPIATNSTPEGRAANRRVEIEYSFTQVAKGHRQYAGQSFTVNNPTSAKKAKKITLVGWVEITQFLDLSKDGWGIYMQRLKSSAPAKILGTAFVGIDKKTPKDRWTRMECSLDVPADSVTYRIDVRLYPPSGTCIWDEISATASDQLGFFSADQATIVKTLTEHAQSTGMGKSTLSIGTNCPLTKKKRTREYPYSERMPISEAIMEFPTLEEGMDVKVVCTPTTRTLTTYYPRKGSNTTIVFALGSNLQTFDVDIDGADISTTIIVQAEGEGSDREEGVTQDASRMDGLVLEKVYTATPLSAISSLRAQSVRGWNRYSQPITVPSVTMMPQYTNELLGKVTEGDRVRVVIKQGWIQVDAQYRITSQTLDPAADQLSYTLVPEDV